KIVFALEQPCELENPRLIERIGMVMHVATLERRADLAAQDAVLVSFRNCSVTWMKIGRRLLNLEHPDVARQQAVHRFAQVRQRDGIGEGKRGDLGQGVHARVSSPGTRYMYRNAFNPGKYRFDRALDGGKPGLHLPAMKISPVVTYCDPDTPHQVGREPGFSTAIPFLHIGQSSGG